MDKGSPNKKVLDWEELQQTTNGQRVLVERIYLPEKEIHVEGRFELPQMARLTSDDQVFVAAFVKSHGSIKEMEQIFGVSYPTIKARLSRIAESLEFVEKVASPSKSDILERLKNGEISATQAIDQLEKLK